MIVLVAAIWVALSAPVVIFDIMGVDASIRLYYSLAAQVFAPFSAAICCYLASLAFPKEDPLRAVWMILSVSGLCWSIGSVFFSIYPIFHAGQETPYPWYGDIGYLIFIPCVLVALWVFKKSLHIQTPLWGWAMAGIICGLGLWLSIVFNLDKLRVSDSPLTYITIILYTIGDPLLLGGTAIVASILGNGIVARPWWLVLIGLVLYYIADLLYTFFSLQEQYATGHMLDVGWPLGFGCIGIAALMTRHLFSEE